MKKMFLVAALFAAAPIFSEEVVSTPAATETTTEVKTETKGFFANTKDKFSGAASSVATSASNAVESVNNFVYNWTPFSDKFVAANDYVTSTLAAHPKKVLVAAIVATAVVVNALQDSEEAEL